MSERPKIPDFVPDDILKPKFASLSDEEWRAFGLLCPLAVNRVLRGAFQIGQFMSAEALISKTYLSLRISQEARCGVLIAVIFAYLESSGIVTISPSFLVERPMNAVKPNPLDAVVSAGPKLKSPEVVEFHRSLVLAALAASIGEVAPTFTRSLFGPPNSV